MIFFIFLIFAYSIKVQYRKTYEDSGCSGDPETHEYTVFGKCFEVELSEPILYNLYSEDDGDEIKIEAFDSDKCSGDASSTNYNTADDQCASGIKITELDKEFDEVAEGMQAVVSYMGDCSLGNAYGIIEIVNESCVDNGECVKVEGTEDIYRSVGCEGWNYENIEPEPKWWEIAYDMYKEYEPLFVFLILFVLCCGCCCILIWGCFCICFCRYCYRRKEEMMENELGDNLIF